MSPEQFLERIRKLMREELEKVGLDIADAEKRGLLRKDMDMIRAIRENRVNFDKNMETIHQFRVMKERATKAMTNFVLYFGSLGFLALIGLGIKMKLIGG